MIRIGTALLAVAALATGSSAGQNPPVVFSDINVIAMEKEEVVAHRDVLVQAGVIRVLEAHRAKGHWPAGTVVVDGKGKYLLPGFSDMHIHTEFGDQEQLKLYLVNGVTTVLNLNGSATALEWRAKISSGEMLGPRFYTSGQIVDGDPPTNNMHVVVHNREEAEKVVDGQVRQGYDFIKPYSALSREEYDGVVAAAKRDHIRLVGHVPWSVGVQGTFEADQDTIAHVEELYRYFVDRHKKPPPDTQPDPARIGTLATLLKAHHTWVISTLSANTDILRQATDLTGVLNSPEMKFVPKSYLEDCRTGGDPYANRGSDWVLQNQIMVPFLFKIVAGLQTAGVSMMAGTDATNPIQVPGISFHDELAALVKAGLSPYEALRTGTINPQTFLGHAKETGTVSPGKVADLVLLEGNPLADIANTRRIAGVMVRGRWLDSSQLEEMKGELIAHFAKEESRGWREQKELGLTAQLCRPPAGANQQESPVGEEFGGLAFEGVSDKLENPAYDEQAYGDRPEVVQECGYDKQDQRENDQWDANGVANAVDRMLVAGGVLRDPVVPGAVAEHGLPLEEDRLGRR